MVLAQMIVEAPKYGASRRAAAISAPRLADPTTKAIARSRARGGGASGSPRRRGLSSCAPAAGSGVIVALTLARDRSTSTCDPKAAAPAEKRAPPQGRIA